jgi:hypothetical protein
LASGPSTADLSIRIVRRTPTSREHKLAVSRHVLPDVRHFFSKRGAYPKFKALLARRGAIDRWHAFEAKATEQALRDWCALNDIEIVG